MKYLDDQTKYDSIRLWYIMSTKNLHDDHLEETTIRLLRRLSTRMILFHQLAAQSLGLFHTDLKSADLLIEYGPMTAGELGRKTGLSTGSVTALIDRLEHAGYVKREKDPNDRRRVIIVPVMESRQQMKKLFSGLSESTIALSKEYSEEELKIIFSFLKKSTDLLEAEIEKLRE